MQTLMILPAFRGFRVLLARVARHLRASAATRQRRSYYRRFRTLASR
jgi:hypothetical protein